jgi:hypothetical protein
MRRSFRERLVPILTGWCEKAMQDNQHQHASITHAHLAYMHYHFDLAAMDAQVRTPIGLQGPYWNPYWISRALLEPLLNLKGAIGTPIGLQGPYWNPY